MVSARPLSGAILVLLSLVACTSGDDDTQADDADVTSTTEPSVRTTTTTTGVAAPETAEEETALERLLPDDVPLPGFRRADERVGAGPLDLEAAARAEADVDAERALLETRRFVEGLSRAWADAGGDVVYLAVYAFAGPREAAFYLQDGTETLIARGAQGFPVDAIPGAIGFTAVEETPDGSFTTHSVAFTSGPHWALAIVGSRGSERTPDDARAVARALASGLA
jgi:hypothetical protein